MHRIELPKTTRAFDVAFSPDGAFFAAALFSVATGQCHAAIWSATTYELNRELTGHRNIVWSLAWAPDGQSLVTASADKTLRLWSLAPKAKPTIMKGHTGVVKCVRLSHDGSKIVSASSDKTVRIWSTSTGAHLGTHTFAKPVAALEFFADDERLITGECPHGGGHSAIQIISVSTS